MARFRMIACYEGLATGDRRKIGVESLTPRELPLTLMGMTQNPEMGGHGLAVVAGRIDTYTRVDASGWVDGMTGETWGAIAAGPVFAWVGEGEFETTDDGIEVEHLVENKTLRGVSVDLAAVEGELEVIEEDEDGWPIDWLETVTKGEIGAATVCNIPAFRGCTIEVLVESGSIPDPAEDAVAAALAALSASLGDVGDETSWLPTFAVLNDGPGCEPCRADLATVTAGGGPMHPPAAWFDDPQLDGPTPLTITDDGRVFGHLAAWGTCHVGIANACVTPPKSATSYAMFRNGAVRTAEGSDVATGRITLGTGHADKRLGLVAAAAHYDDTGTAVADIASGDDGHGIWVAGALRPDATDLQIRQLRASPLSGDWRRHGRALELVAALAVNVPGFPIPRTEALVAGGVVQSLVAAGVNAQPTLHRGTADDPSLPAELRAAAADLRAATLDLTAERHLRRLARAR